MASSDYTYRLIFINPEAWHAKEHKSPKRKKFIDWESCLSRSVSNRQAPLVIINKPMVKKDRTSSYLRSLACQAS